MRLGSLWDKMGKSGNPCFLGTFGAGIFYEYGTAKKEHLLPGVYSGA